jgi:hypothetical protein
MTHFLYFCDVGGGGVIAQCEHFSFSRRERINKDKQGITLHLLVNVGSVKVLTTGGWQDGRILDCTGKDRMLENEIEHGHEHGHEHF